MKSILCMVAVAFLTLTACSTIGPYSEEAYQQATSLKVDSLALMGKANEDYSSHVKDVDTLNTSLSKAYEYAKGRPENQVSTKQWEILLDPQGHSLGGFLTRWKKEKALNPAYIREEQGLIGAEFDAISGLESGKTKETN